MEVKINREIRNYTEAMFFGLIKKVPANERPDAGAAGRKSRGAPGNNYASGKSTI